MITKLWKPVKKIINYLEYIVKYNIRNMMSMITYVV